MSRSSTLALEAALLRTTYPYFRGCGGGICACVDHKPARDFDVKSNVLCCERARKVFGWSANVPMEEDLRKIVDSLKAIALIARSRIIS